MVVRGELGGALPGAGVGCAFARPMLGTIATEMRGTGPFSVDSLTEDYELGLKKTDWMKMDDLAEATAAGTAE